MSYWLNGLNRDAELTRGLELWHRGFPGLMNGRASIDLSGNNRHAISKTVALMPRGAHWYNGIASPGGVSAVGVPAWEMPGAGVPAGDEDAGAEPPSDEQAASRPEPSRAEPVSRI
jgi:hypothetical protein